MKMKKFALRGLLILAIVVALCMFFSGTVRTLTTPKVRFAQAKNGKFEQEIELKGKVVFAIWKLALSTILQKTLRQRSKPKSLNTLLILMPVSASSLQIQRKYSQV